MKNVHHKFKKKYLLDKACIGNTYYIYLHLHFVLLMRYDERGETKQIASSAFAHLGDPLFLRALVTKNQVSWLNDVTNIEFINNEDRRSCTKLLGKYPQNMKLSYPYPKDSDSKTRFQKRN